MTRRGKSSQSKKSSEFNQTGFSSLSWDSLIDDSVPQPELKSSSTSKPDTESPREASSSPSTSLLTDAAMMDLGNVLRALEEQKYEERDVMAEWEREVLSPLPTTQPERPTQPASNGRGGDRKNSSDTYDPSKKLFYPNSSSPNLRRMLADIARFDPTVNSSIYQNCGSPDCFICKGV